MSIPNILICGPSGSGKSTSLRNLDPERTIVINTEMKELPFRAARKFKMQSNVPTFDAYTQVFAKAAASDKADVIVVDSFTSLTEHAYAQIVRPIERVGDKVMAAWQAYKDALHDALVNAKNCDKAVVFLGIDDAIQDDQQRMLRTCAVQGSLKGKVEKEFSIVLWTKVIPPSLTEQDAKPQHVFITNSDGECKAKTPMEMFDALHVPNDLAAVIKQIRAYYSDDEQPTAQPEQSAA